MNNINYCNCVYYKRTGATFGGCKHPYAKKEHLIIERKCTACIYGCIHYISRYTKVGKGIIKKRKT
jgi:hypothetical protein